MSATAKYNLNNESEWGDAIKCSVYDKDLPVGTIVALCLYGDSIYSLFVITGEYDHSTRGQPMYRGVDGNWVIGFSWNFKKDNGYPASAFKVHTSTPLTSVGVLHKDGCICKRCHSKNEYAAPNQKDGSYVCFECR